MKDKKIKLAIIIAILVLGVAYAAFTVNFTINGTAKIKNLNVDKATIVGRGYVGVIGGALYGSLDNCHVTNSTVTGKEPIWRPTMYKYSIFDGL